MAADSPIQISVTSGADKLSQREQIEQVLARAQGKNEALRVRIPVTLYDHAESRGYVFLREATWNLQLPIAQTTPETVEDLIQTLGACINAIAREGSVAVREKLA